MLLLAVAAGAQQDAARLSGSVVDPQGLAVAGARVAVESIATGQRRETRTGDDGVFDVPSLSPGVYTVHVELTGFRPLRRDRVRLPVGTPVTLDLRLEIGTAEQAVTVLADASLLNTRDATIGNPFSGLQITQLPLEGRNVAALLSLQPGVTYVGDTNVLFRGNFGEPDADARNGSVNGGRSDQANVTLDGVDVNDQQSGFAFTSVLRVTTESVQEFRVVTTNPNADQGRSSGAQVALITRSGTNELHGSLFHSHRNTATTANSFFNNRAGLPKAKLIRNVFSGALGGPVVRNRLFAFGVYEGRRDASEAGTLRNVPTALFRQGFVRYRNRDGQIVTLSPEQVRAIDPQGLGVNRASLALLQQFPLPNDTPTLDPLNFAGYRFNSAVREHQNTSTLRLDAPVSDRHALFARGSIQSDTGTAPLQFPNTPPPFLNRNTSKGLAAGDTWSVRPTLVNSFRYGFTRAAIEDVGTTTGPLFSFGGGIGAPYPMTYSRGRVNPVHNFVNDLAWTRGRHSWQFGTNIRLVRNDRYSVEPNRVLLVTQQSRLANLGYDILPADIAGTPASQNDFVRAAIIAMGVLSQGNAAYNYDRQGNLIPNGQPLRRSFATNEFEWYAQDSWRPRPNLTLTLGLRYSLYSPLTERNGLEVAPTVTVGDWFRQRADAAAAGLPTSSVAPLTFDFAGSANGRTGFYDWDRNNFAPRVAAAWTPGVSDGWLGRLTGGPGRTVLRGGASVVYDRVGSASAVLYDSIGSFGLSSTLVNPAGQLSVATAPRMTAPDVVPGGLLPAPPPFQFPQQYPRAPRGLVGAIVPAPDASLRTPYAVNYSATMQRELAGGLSLEAGYVGRQGRNLLTMFDAAAPANLRDPASGATYFEAAQSLFRQTAGTLAGVSRVPYWENLFPGLATTAGELNRLYPAFSRLNPGVAADTALSASQVAWFLYTQANPTNAIAALQAVDVRCSPSCSRSGPNAMYNDQFASLFSWRSIAPSMYHSLQVMLRKRLSHGLQFDVNYTLSESRDWTSGAERGDAFSGSFVINSFAPEQMEGPSDFDLRHQLNANWLYELPFARRNPLLGGWQVAGLLRVTSGFPVTVLNGLGFPTNHYFRGFGRPIGDLPETAQNKNGPTGPNLFADPARAVQAFGTPLPGETGVRNNLRGDGLFTLDLGAGKSFALPGREGHHIQFRAEAFNATNSVRFNTRSLNVTTGGAGFGTYSGLLVNPRVFQFLLRYQF